MVRFLGLDIGGANIKLATHDGTLLSVPFAMWKCSHQLKDRLASLAVDEFANATMIGVTMTAELADCFESKAVGVRHVIDAVCGAFPDQLVRFWLTSGEFAAADDASEFPALVAAANWHALATWVGRAIPHGPALLVDMGSTTTDVIPLLNGAPVAEGLSDLERLKCSELVYTGATRTPLCAVARSVTLDGVEVSLAAELFATMLDVRLILNEVPEDPRNHDTADGRPASRACALNRLAHMLCCDTTELSEMQLVEIARQLRQQQQQQIAAAVRNRMQYLSDLQTESVTCPSAEGRSKSSLVISGSGRGQVRQVIESLGEHAPVQVMDLAQMWRTDVSECACAFAVARLVSERCLDDLLPMSTL